jgi:tetratricopeptide (TPR) repeat protein
LDLLARLADKSLVQVEERDGEARYGMLETIRQYGLERLRAAGDEAEVLARHRAWFLRLAREAESHYRTASEPEWLGRLERDQDNFRAVLRRFAREGGDPAAAVELASCLGRFWELKGLVQEALEWADVLLPHEAELADTMRARYLESIGWLNKLGGRLAVSKELLVRATEMWQEVGGRLGEARSLAALAGTLQLMGEFDAAWEAGTRSLELFEAEGFGPGVQSALNQLGLMAADGGDQATARTWYERCLEVARERGDKRAMGIALHNLAMVAWFVGDLARAEAQLAEALVHVAEIGDRAIEARAWIVAASIAVDRLSPERAVECLRQALTGGAEIGDVVTIVNGLEQAARAFVQLARPRDALRLVGAAAAGREALTIVLPAAYYEVIVARTVARAREELGDEEADRALADGRAMSLEEAIGLACAYGTGSGSDRVDRAR